MNKKEIVLTIIKESKYLRNKLSFKNHLKMFMFFESQSNKEIESNLANNNINVSYNNPLKKDSKYWVIAGLVATSLVLPVPGLTLILLKVKNSVMIPCKAKCIKSLQKIGGNESYCTAECTYISTKYTVDFLENELKKCKYLRKPKKCQKRLYKLLIQWKPRLQESKLKMEAKKREQKRLQRR